jgi:hypothetical protein
MQTTPSTRRRMARVASQAALVLLAGFTAKEATSLVLVAPIALCGLVAAARNGNEEVDAIDVYWLLWTLFFVVRPAQTLIGNSATMYAARAPFHYDPDIILLTFAALYIFSIIMLVLLPRTGRAADIVEVAPATGLLLFAALVGFAATVAFSGDLGNLLAPRYDKQADQISPLMAAGQGVLIASAAMMTAAFAGSRRHGFVDGFVMLCCLSLLAVAFNPLNTSRFGLIGAWLPIALILVPAIRKPVVFAAITLFSIVVVMPVLSVTTRFGWDLDQVLNSSERGSLGEIPYIDTFDALLHGVYFAHQFGMQFGAKILSIILCFVPRAWWAEKPGVSGLDIGNQLFVQGLVGTPNLSMPIVGDFYMDFGLLGVVVGAMAVALGFRALLRAQPSVAGYPIYGYLLIAALSIVVRGAVGAVILLPACTMLACVLLSAPSRRRAQALSGRVLA